VEKQWLEAVDPEVLQRRRQKIVLVLGGLLLFAVVGGLAYWLSPRLSSSDDLPLAAQVAVSHQLQARGKLLFNSASEAQVVPQAPGQFLVRGWVRDIAADGRSWNYFYSVTVVVGQSDYTFRDISVTEQF